RTREADGQTGKRLRMERPRCRLTAHRSAVSVARYPGPRRCRSNGGKPITEGLASPPNRSDAQHGNVTVITSWRSAIVDFRPAAWWDYDAPALGVRRPARQEYEKATLWEADLLSPKEKAMLEAQWREHFDHAVSADFFGFCIGYDRVRHCAIWAKGDEARREHHRWAGIPRALIKKWTAEHGRRAKTIR